MTVNYGVTKYPEVYAKASGRDLPISTKQCIEICKHLKGRKLQKARQILEEVMEKKRPIPFTRFTTDMGHKKGMAAGRYPNKASSEILKILKAVEANAQVKGLSTNDLVIFHMAANKASTPWRYGRKRRVKAKRSHVEIVVTEEKLEGKKEGRARMKKSSKQANAHSQKTESASSAKGGEQ